MAIEFCDDIFSSKFHSSPLLSQISHKSTIWVRFHGPSYPRKYSNLFPWSLDLWCHCLDLTGFIVTSSLSLKEHMARHTEKAHGQQGKVSLFTCTYCSFTTWPEKNLKVPIVIQQDRFKVLLCRSTSTTATPGKVVVISSAATVPSGLSS